MSAFDPKPKSERLSTGKGIAVRVYAALSDYRDIASRVHSYGLPFSRLTAYPPTTLQ